MRLIIALMAVLLLAAGAVPAGAQEVRELLGSWIIDGYTFQPGDRSPRGTIAYDGDANVFKGTYVGLKLPAQRPQLHAWLYNTQTKRTLHLGKVGYKTGTVGKTKGDFTLTLPAEFKGGKFSAYELVAFSALPGANVPGIYCGHGQDFSFTSNQDHTCFD